MIWGAVLSCLYSTSVYPVSTTHIHPGYILHQYIHYPQSTYILDIFYTNISSIHNPHTSWIYSTSIYPVSTIHIHPGYILHQYIQYPQSTYILDIFYTNLSSIHIHTGYILHQYIQYPHTYWIYSTSMYPVSIIKK